MKGKSPGYKRRRYDRVKADRISKPSKYILVDSRSSDKKKGLTGNDLDEPFVIDTISHGCEYCGDSTGRMTLDRIDNSKAHTKDNVKPSCLRCNYARSDMPFSAWLELVPGMRSAREKGLFGDWDGHRGKKKVLG